MLLFLPLLLAGCASFSQKLKGRGAADLAGTRDEAASQAVIMPLASPMGPERRIVQQLTAEWPDRQETLLCVLELDQQRISMAGLTPEGLSLFSLNYDGHALILDKNPMLPDSVAPELVIADLQLAFWPVSALEKILPMPWRLEADSRQRSLYYGGERRIDVHYLADHANWPDRVELVNHHYHYRLLIKTISYDVVSE